MTSTQLVSEGTIEVADLRPGDVLLYHRESLLGRVMRLFDGTEVSHAALYLGDGVAEAIGEGVLRRSLTMSLGHDPGDYILVHRLKEVEPVDGVDGVVRKASEYLERRLAYGYSSVALIALLCLTRKIPLTRKARILFRLLLDRATAELLASTDPTKLRLICSEFVFRCYSEADSLAASAHAIEIAGASVSGEREYESTRGFSDEGQRSLLDQARELWVAQDRMLESGRVPGSSAPPPVSDEEIERAAEDYLREESTQGPAKRELERAAGTLRDDPELFRSLRRFASAVDGTGGQEKQIERALTPERSFERFEKVVARFVSPGDLLKSPSLRPCGRLVIDLDDRREPRRVSHATTVPESAGAADGAAPRWTAADDAELDQAIQANRRAVVGLTVLRLAEVLSVDAGVVTSDRVVAILKSLRRKRFFGEMLAIGEALGRQRRDGIAEPAAVLYAQALIDTDQLDAALSLLHELVPRCAQGSREELEARGLIGRVHKQAYVKMVVASEAEVEQQRRTMADAIEAYHEVYRRAKVETWHGINVVALIDRARRDGLKIAAPAAAETLALEILETIEKVTNPDEWLHATAAEALVALGRWDEALARMGQYVTSPSIDAFECASTLRQLEQVWQLRQDGPGGALVVLLRSMLLMKGGVDARREVGKTVGVELPIGGLRTALAGVERHEQAVEKTLERSFTGRARPLQFYYQGLNRARSVARVETTTGTGVGTGFLVRGEDFFPNEPTLAGELVLMTNAHVLGATDPDALRPEQAAIRFEEVGDLEDTLGVREILFESAPDALDVTIVRLSATIPGVEPFLLARTDPRKIDPHRPRPLYAIGHPNGGKLSISMEDCFQVGWEPPRYVHYRTPTEPGSSGSAVCDDYWCLVALHHAAVADKNEGIWIQSIVEATKASAPVVTAAPAVSKAALRSGVFISYSHADKDWLHRLQQMLTPALAGESIDAWDDTRIQPGTAWEREIEKAIDVARVAILLVTPAFLASDFIQRKELAPILSGSRSSNLTVFWIAVRPTVFEFTPLKHLQAANDPKFPLLALEDPECDETLAAIVRKIRSALDTNRVKNAFNVADQMALLAAGMGGTARRPDEFSARANQHGGRIDITDRGGRTVTTIDSSELENLPEPERRLIAAYEEGMRRAYDAYIAAFPEQFSVDVATRKRVGREVKSHQRDVCFNLNLILDFLQSKGKNLQDHYGHVRAICASRSDPG